MSEIRIYGNISTETMAQHEWVTLEAHLEALDAEIGKVSTLTQERERLTDLVRYQRHELFDAKLIDDQEFAALVADSESGQRVARLEGYDRMRTELSQARARARAANECDRSDLAEMREPVPHYNCVQTTTNKPHHLNAHMVEHPHGDYVAASNFHALKQERDRLKAKLELWGNRMCELSDENDQLRTELSQAKAGWDSCIADLREAAQICLGVEAERDAARLEIESLHANRREAKG